MKTWLPLIVVLIVFLAFGCSERNPQPERAAVNGTVYVDGKPLQTGSIQFIPTGDTKGPAAAAIIQNGDYELASENGPVVGRVRIEIREAIDPGFDWDDPEAFMKRGTKPLPRSQIPPEYNERSELTRTVQSESNRFDFKITTRKKRPTR